jgi:hypothetical protein
LIVELKVMAGEEELHDSLHRVLARVSESASR